MQQLSLMFEPGLAQRSRTLREHLATKVYGIGLTTVAGKIDCSPSHLTEKLAGSSTDGKVRCLSVDEFELYIQTTGDVTGVLYLVDKYLRDPEVQRQEALGRLADILPMIPALCAAAGVDFNGTARKKR